MKKYNAKYFGVVTGFLAVILFGRLQYNSKVSDFSTEKIIKPFIPFFNEPGVINLIGGTLVSFIWGWVLGYLLVIIYNKVDQVVR